MGLLTSIFLIVYFIVSVFTGNADTNVLIAAGLFMIAGSISICSASIDAASEKNNVGTKVGEIIGSMMRTFNGMSNKKDEESRE